MESQFISMELIALFIPLISIVFIIPYIIFQYYKEKSISKIRTFVIFSFIFYLVCAYFLTISPLMINQDDKNIDEFYMEDLNLKPFKIIEDILKKTKAKFSKPDTYYNMLTEKGFLRFLGNILMTLPLGIYLRYFFKKSLKGTIIITFLISLLFELTKFIGIYGLYKISYKSFDIDNLILNTVGGIIGYGISPVLNVFFPEEEKKNEDFLRVGYIRRLLGFIIDIIILRLIPGINYDIRKKIIMYFIYFIIFPYFTNGRTIGSWATFSRIKGKGKKIRFKEIFIRNSILMYGIIGINLFFNILLLANNSKEYRALNLFIGIIQLAYYFFLIAHYSLTIIRRERFFYERLSETKIIVEDQEKERKIRMGE